MFSYASNRKEVEKKLFLVCLWEFFFNEKDFQLKIVHIRSFKSLLSAHCLRNLFFDFDFPHILCNK